MVCTSVLVGGHDCVGGGGQSDRIGKSVKSSEMIFVLVTEVSAIVLKLRSKQLLTFIFELELYVLNIYGALH
jgi:hypothetical protein